MSGFFDDSDDDDDTPAPAPAPAPAPVTAQTVSALRNPSDDLPRVSIMDRPLFNQGSSSQSTQLPTPMAAPPTPPPAVTTEAKRKPFGDDDDAEAVGQRSPGAGSSLDLQSIMAKHEKRTNHLALEEVRKGRKAPMRSAAKGAPSGGGAERTADKGKRQRLSVEDLEEEALPYGSGDDEEEEADDEEVTFPISPHRSPPSPTPPARSPFSRVTLAFFTVLCLTPQAEVAAAIEEEDDDGVVEWPRFDGDGWAPKEPHPLGPRPKPIEGQPSPTLPHPAAP